MESSNKIGTEIVRDENGRVVSGVLNPNGRPPKGQTMTDLMRQVLEEEGSDGKKKKEMLVRKVLELALSGNEVMVKMAFGYLDGMPVQKNELSGNDGEPLDLVIKDYRGINPPTKTK